MNYPESFQKIINCLKLLPGVGEKTAERYAFSLLNLEPEKLDEFGELVKNISKNITECSVCGCLSDTNKCMICGDLSRNQDIICVVENKKNIYTFEKVGMFKTKYHVLGGLISPMDGVGPEDINLSSLVKRIESLENPELILALKSSIEGETTTLYIKKIFEEKNVTISRLSYGIPIGAEIDYLDIMTLDKALEDRKKISE